MFLKYAKRVSHSTPPAQYSASRSVPSAPASTSNAAAARYLPAASSAPLWLSDLLLRFMRRASRESSWLMAWGVRRAAEALAAAMLGSGDGEDDVEILVCAAAPPPPRGEGGGEGGGKGGDGGGGEGGGDNAGGGEAKLLASVGYAVHASLAKQRSPLCSNSAGQLTRLQFDCSAPGHS